MTIAGFVVRFTLHSVLLAVVITLSEQASLFGAFVASLLFILVWASGDRR